MNHLAWTSLWIALVLLAGCGRLGVRIVAVSGPDAETYIEEDGGTHGEDVDAPASDGDASSESDAGLPAIDAQLPTPLDAAVDAGAATDASGALADSAASDAASPSALILRYDFAGTGTMVQDRIGSAHGEILGGAQLDGSGGLTFDGTNDFVNLPNGLVSSRTSVTVMAWLSWGGGACWQRIFDFGSNSGGEDNVGNATSAFSLSPASCPNYIVTGLFELNSSLRAANAAALTVGTSAQVALVMDGTRATIASYVNGVAMGETAVTWQLSQLNDVNNWLGRSQWTQDKFLQGRLDEFRIYGAALSSAEIAALNARGPNAP
jgi:hypothetical protein